MSHAVSETHPGTAGVTCVRWRDIARVAVLFALSALFLTGWFSSLSPRSALDAGLRVLTAVLFMLAVDRGPRMQPGPARLLLVAAALIMAAVEWARHVHLSVATELDVSFAWGYTGVLLVMLLISAVQFIRDRRAHPSAAAAETAEPAASNRPDCTGQWS